MSEPVANKLQFEFDWKTSVLILLLLPLLVSLGFWQLDRADEKAQLQALFDERQASPPISIGLLNEGDDLRYQPVKLTGEFVNGKSLFLDNRIYRGKFGYEVVTPFKVSNSNMTVLVNRGWVKGDISRRSLPSVDAIDAGVEIVAQVYVPQGEMLVLEKLTVTGWPKVMQSLNIEALASGFDTTLFPFSVRLSENSVGFLASNWSVVNLRPDKHVGYAFQWFAMSITLLIIGFLTNTNFWALRKLRKKSV